MSENWVSNLDMLAQAGVLNYDAAADVKGLPPRYIGNPIGEPSPFPDNVPNAPKLTQPQQDEFNQSEEKENYTVKNPSWKKWAFGILATGLLIYGAVKCKSVYNWIKGKFKKS